MLCSYKYIPLFECCLGGVEAFVGRFVDTILREQSIEEKRSPCYWFQLLILFNIAEKKVRWVAKRKFHNFSIVGFP